MIDVIENLPVKIDEVGRVVIPQKVRKKYDIKKDCVLSLTLKKEGIIFTKQDNQTDFNKLLEKICKIEKFYNYEVLLANKDKILYASKKYDNLKDKKISNEVRKIILKKSTKQQTNLNLTEEFNLTEPYYYSSINFNNYTNYLLIIIYKDESSKKIASSICKLLS